MWDVERLVPSIGVCRLVWWAVLSESGDRAVADWRPSQIVATFAAVNYWLVKSEPSAYSWENLVGDKSTSWTGVRNFTARNNLRAMRLGDEVLFYHICLTIRECVHHVDQLAHPAEAGGPHIDCA